MAQLAVEFELDRRTVKKRLARVKPGGQTERGYPGYFMTDAAPALLEIEAQEHTADPEKMNPRERKEWYEGERRRRELQIQDGELYVAHEQDREVSRVFKMVANGLEALPDILERDAGLQGHQLEPVFRAIDSMREQLFQEIANRPDCDSQTT